MKSEESARSAARAQRDRRAGDSRRPCSGGSSPPARHRSRTAPAGAGTASAAAPRGGPRSDRRPCRADGRSCSGCRRGQGSRPARDQPASPRRVRRWALAMVGVDVLAQQRELAGTRCHEARLAQHAPPAGSARRRACRARRRRCRTCRSLPGSSGTPRRRRPPDAGSSSNLLSPGSRCRAPRPRRLPRTAWPAARAGDGRPAGRPRCRRTGTLDDQLALGLGHAARDRDGACRAVPAHARRSRAGGRAPRRPSRPPSRGCGRCSGRPGRPPRAPRPRDSLSGQRAPYGRNRRRSSGSRRS